MKQNAKPSLAVNPLADQQLMISVGGDWSLQWAAPSFDELAPHFESKERPAEIRFTMADLGTYDSSLVSMLVAMAKRCQADRIKLNSDGFPEGVRQLLKIALAVPKRKTREAPER